MAKKVKEEPALKGTLAARAAFRGLAFWRSSASTSYVDALVFYCCCHLRPGCTKLYMRLLSSQDITRLFDKSPVTASGNGPHVLAEEEL